MSISKNYLLAVGTLIGTVTGAGIFAMPYVLNRSGLFPFLIIFPSLVAVQCLIHLTYAKVILSTKGEHRLPGYVEIYAGKKWKNISSVLALLGGYGALLAYIILGGIFAYQLLHPYLGGDLLTYSLVLMAIESLVVLIGLRAIAGAEFYLTILLILMFFVLTIKSLGYLRMDNYSLVNWSYFLLPYGPIFFAIGGDAAIPEVCRLLSREKEKIKSAILWGTILPAALMLVFVLAVSGVTGAATTPDTLTGLKNFFGDGIVVGALFFGLLCIITSYLVIAQATREIYWWDYKMNKNLAWFLACFIPLIFFLGGLRNLTVVVSFFGALSGGVLGVTMVLLSRAVDRHYQKKSPISIKTSVFLAALLSLLFLLGIFSETASLFFKR
jgi:tyrosine-specific transport protein